MHKYKLKFTQLQQAIFRLLCINASEKLNQRQIAKALKVSPTAVAKALPLLEKEQLITKEHIGTMNLILIKLNRDNPKVIQLKKVENLKQVYESGLVEFLQDDLPGTVMITLFGSYSKGEDTATSDIDIAIIGRKPKQLALAEFEKVLERKIIVNFYDSLSEIHKDLKESILNGLVLFGSVQL